jgi:hypothetical protein
MFKTERQQSRIRAAIQNDKKRKNKTVEAERVLVRQFSTGFHSSLFMFHFYQFVTRLVF